MTGGNHFFVFRDELRPWDLERDPVALSGLHDLRYWAAVFGEVDRRCPALGIRVVATQRVDALPLSGADVVVLVLNDDIVRMPAYAHEVGLVLKPAGTSNPVRVSGGPPSTWPAAAVSLALQIRTQGRRAPSYVRGWARTLRGHGRPRVVDVPLGVFALRPVRFVPFDERSYDVWFRGSRLVHTPRRGALGRIESQKTRSRHELVRQLHALQAERPDIRTHFATVASFHDSASFATEYSETLMQARIALCPRGTVADTYRLCEALSFGTVAVVEERPRRPFYEGAPLIEIGRWTRLPGLLDELLADRQRLMALHEASLAWWRDRLSPQATAGRIIDALRSSRMA